MLPSFLPAWEYEVRGELEAATEVLAMDERSTVLYYKNVSTPGDGLGEGARLPTLRISVAEHPLPELFRVDDILDADVTRGPIAGLLIPFRVGNISSGGEGHVRDLVLALCLVRGVFVVVQGFRGGVCQESSPGVGACSILFDGLVEARLGFRATRIVRMRIVQRACVGRVWIIERTGPS